MSDDTEQRTRAAAEDVLAMVEEVEASGDATLGGRDLARARALLHAWVDTVVGVVTVPAFGRVTLLHAEGKPSTISSPDLTFTLSLPPGKT